MDITSVNPTNWVVSVIYQTRDASGKIQPITTVPAVTLNPEFPQLLGTMVYVGTGQLLGVADLANTNVQSMYGIFDPPTASAPPLGFAGIPTRANLVQQVLANDITSANVPALIEPTVHPVTLPQPNRGWFVDLSLNPGNRIISDPEIESGGGVVFTTYLPNTSQCVGGGSAWLMVLNYATGGAFPLPELDTNSDGKLDSNDVSSTGKNPVGMSLGPVYASAVTFLPSCGSGTCKNMKLTSVSSNNVDSIMDRGQVKQRIHWWEIRH